MDRLTHTRKKREHEVVEEDKAMLQLAEEAHTQDNFLVSAEQVEVGTKSSGKLMKDRISWRSHMG